MKVLALRLLALPGAMLFLCAPAYAVILYSSPVRNTTAPTGDLSNSGWQFEGNFRGFTGTPISPQYFITAQHIGGEFDATNTFLLNGGTYTITTAGNYFDCPGSDLRIWKINETFPAGSWASLYSTDLDGSELNKPLVVFGRGTQRGDPITVNSQLKGWKWGSGDSVLSWGENAVSNIISDQNFGDLLTYQFDANAGPNEGIISSGDSGGGVFIQSHGTWKLAGVNLGVDDPWRLTADGQSFDAAIFDASGLYAQTGDPPAWELISDHVPAASYATRIASYLDWIEYVIGPSDIAPVPEPVSSTLLVLSSFVLLIRPTRPNRKKFFTSDNFIVD